MRSFFSKLNPRQLVIHFIASWFFLYGVHTLATLLDYSFLYTAKQPFMSPIYIQQKYDSDMLVVSEAGIAGLIIAYIISWRVSVRKNWFWLNSVIVFLAAFILTIFNLLGWKELRKIVLSPARIFDVNTVAYILTGGIIMLAVGSFLFFNKKIINFIDKGVKHVRKPAVKKGARPAAVKRKK
jgi:hypothetical protein